MKISNIEVKIIKVAKSVHRTIGCGHLENTYAACMIYELEKEQLKVNYKSLKIFFYGKLNNNQVAEATFIVEGKVIIRIINNASIEDLFCINNVIMSSKKIKFGFIIDFEANLSSNCLLKVISG